LTVLSYLGLGPASGTKLGLRSVTDASQWLFVLSTGATQVVQNTDVKDSNASGGITVLANDGTSVDEGNNNHWDFGSTRYWVASAAGVWSSTVNWSTISGGAPGTNPPTSGQSAIFDGNGRGN